MTFIKVISTNPAAILKHLAVNDVFSVQQLSRLLKIAVDTYLQGSISPAQYQSISRKIKKLDQQKLLLELLKQQSNTGTYSLILRVFLTARPSLWTAQMPDPAAALLEKVKAFLTFRKEHLEFEGKLREFEAQ